ncbi:MAG TPA: 3'(2'),5'-bisphosphate nucleotidase CysQ [Gemmatimonadales bacterium]|nr:3'(2'),5'-bisphosphate nucleotidase CysQ [Gemmatimonadales bacterium]
MTGDFRVTPDALVRLAALAVEAGQAVLEEYRPDVAVELKTDRTPVTAADRAAQDVILRGLTAWTPDIPVVSEEGEIPGPAARASWPRFWLVDPLDGTKEFLKRNGEFTVNIALVQRGAPVLGVVHAPALGVLYYGGDGLGSWKRVGDGPAERLTSQPPAPGQPLRVVESRSHPSPELDRFLASHPVSERLQVGSSLKFCWVAEGRADIYPRFGPTMEWDVAAGDCIFRNSGAGRPRASPLRYNHPDLRNPGFVIGLDDPPPSGGSAQAAVVWLTGLSGAGKSTIAQAVVQALETRGRPVEYLDGDVIREAFPTTGFTRAERDAHVRRVGWVASRLERHGVTVVASLISPYAESRAFVRGLCRRFIEIWVSTPLEECARRDVKGLYAKARAGKLPHFTGLDDPYEPPCDPALTLDTTSLSVDQAVERVLGVLLPDQPDRRKR